jgi:uncharacterized membrane protein YkoI
MNIFLKASVLVVFFSGISLAKAEENIAAGATKETTLPVLQTEELPTVSLEDAIKQVMQDSKNKVLTAKTELVGGKKIHVIKILTSAGHIQHIKIDAVTGKPLDKLKK